MTIMMLEMIEILSALQIYYIVMKEKKDLKP